MFRPLVVMIRQTDFTYLIIKLVKTDGFVLYYIVKEQSIARQRLAKRAFRSNEYADGNQSVAPRLTYVS
jgi:hypothetical protein